MLENVHGTTTAPLWLLYGAFFNSLSHYKPPILSRSVGWYVHVLLNRVVWSMSMVWIVLIDVGADLDV